MARGGLSRSQVVSVDPVSTPLLRSEAISVVDYLCRASRGDDPFVERHEDFSVSQPGRAASGVPGAAAIANAVEDALADLGIVIREVPVTPARLFALLRAAGHAAVSADGTRPQDGLGPAFDRARRPRVGSTGSRPEGLFVSSVTPRHWSTP